MWRERIGLKEGAIKGRFVGWGSGVFNQLSPRPHLGVVISSSLQNVVC